MNKSHKIFLGMAITTLLVTVGCGGRDNDTATIVQDPTAVPQGAGSSATAYLNFIRGLKSNDETSEPLTFNDNFGISPDETSEAEVIA